MNDETWKVKVHKVTLLIVDHDGCGHAEIETVIENQKYPNRCISPDVMEIETVEIDYHEQHPINIIPKRKEAFKQLFSEAPPEDTDHKPCPFCGSTENEEVEVGVTVTEHGGVVGGTVACGRCGASGPSVDETEEPIMSQEDGFAAAWKLWDERT